MGKDLFFRKSGTTTIKISKTIGKNDNGATVVPPKSFERKGKLVMGKASSNSFQLRSVRFSLNLITFRFFRQHFPKQ